MSLFLIIDTSIVGVGVSLYSDTEGRLSFDAEEKPFASARALPMIVTKVLERSGYSLNDLNGIVVSSGPGTFTGIKVGLSYVAGLSVAQSLDIMGISSIFCLSGHLERPVLLKATKQQGYLCFPGKKAVAVELDELGIRARSADQLISWADLGQHAIVLPVPWPEIEELLTSNSLEFEVLDEGGVQESVVGSMEAHLAKTGFSGDSKMPEPLYIRMSAPEEKAAKNKGGL